MSSMPSIHLAPLTLCMRAPQVPCHLMHVLISHLPVPRPHAPTTCLHALLILRSCVVLCVLPMT